MEDRLEYMIVLSEEEEEEEEEEQIEEEKHCLFHRVDLLNTSNESVEMEEAVTKHV